MKKVLLCILGASVGLYAAKPASILKSSPSNPLAASKNLNEAVDARKFALEDAAANKTKGKISVEVLRNPEVAPTLYTSIEDDKDATEIHVRTALTALELEQLIPVLEYIHMQLPPPKTFAKLGVIEQKKMLEALVARLDGFAAGSRMPALAYAAHWIGSQALEHAALWRYATFLHRKRPDEMAKQIAADMSSQGVLPGMRENLARYYYLQFDEEIEPLLWPKQAGKPQKWVYLDLDVLTAYDKFPSDFLRLMKRQGVAAVLELPIFITNGLFYLKPGEKEPNYHKQAARMGEKQRMKFVIATLKLRDFSPEMNSVYPFRPYLAGAVSYRDIGAVKKLVEHGGDVNMILESGQPLMMNAVVPSRYSYPAWKKAYKEIIEYLIAHGADVKAAYEYVLKSSDPDNQYYLELLRPYMPKK